MKKAIPDILEALCVFLGKEKCCSPQELVVCNSLNADGRCPAGKSWRHGFERKTQHMKQQFAHRT